MDWLTCPRKLCRIKLQTKVRQLASAYTFDKILLYFCTGFNKSLRIKSRAERLTGGTPTTSKHDRVVEAFALLRDFGHMCRHEILVEKLEVLHGLRSILFPFH